jgi:hypothetical protein
MVHLAESSGMDWARLLPVVLWAFAPLACSREPLVVEQVGGVRAVLPAWGERRAVDDPAAGFVERSAAGRGRVLIGWEADARRGAPSGDEALAAAGLGEGGHLLRGASDGGAQPLAVDGHPAALVGSDEARVLVWRCDRTGRTLHLSVAGERAPPLDRLAAELRCHRPGERPVDGEVPIASATALGPEWRLAQRGPASAGWLRGDSVLTLFAGQLTAPPHDLVEGAHLAPGWASAAGLEAAVVRRGGRSPGPLAHPALRFDGEATLGGTRVRWTLLWWRCLVRGRSYAALVFAEAPALPTAPGPGPLPDPVGGPLPDPVGGGLPDWTGRDSALLAARCHG